MDAEMKQEETGMEMAEEPVSPTGQYFNSSALSIAVLAVLESQVPIDDSPALPFLRNVFLPINPRFSSIMGIFGSWLLGIFLVAPRRTGFVGDHGSGLLASTDLVQTSRSELLLGPRLRVRSAKGSLAAKGLSAKQVRDKDGAKQWKKVKVNLKDHLTIPVFQPANSTDFFYDDQFDDYFSKIAAEQLPQSRPLWEIHIVKYPTRNAAGHVIFKLHHALGDGFSLMGALLSCLQRVDDPSLPITFPAIRMKSSSDGAGEDEGIFRSVSRIFAGLVNTASDFGWSVLKSGFVEDDRTAIRSGDPGVEFRPVAVTTMTFSLDHIKRIKSNLRVTINDVMTGIIFLGTRLYMKETSGDHFNKSNSTALVLLNTRNINGYKSVEEMVKKPDGDAKWGNQFGFLHVAIPDLLGDEYSNPTSFVFKAQEIIGRHINSAAVYLTAKLLEALRKYRGPEVRS
ncbi:hypothetical protein U1Q18_001561 [Sarracenia purpurea var. burkii]